jgi:hypothetical protein
VAHTFLVTAVLFGLMSIIGYITKMDLSKRESFLFVGLIGLVIALLVNIFWTNTTLGWIITFAGILLFLGLTVYESNTPTRQWCKNPIGILSKPGSWPSAMWAMAVGASIFRIGVMFAIRMIFPA